MRGLCIFKAALFLAVLRSVYQYFQVGFPLPQSLKERERGVTLHPFVCIVEVARGCNTSCTVFLRVISFTLNFKEGVNRGTTE